MNPVAQNDSAILKPIDEELHIRTQTARHRHVHTRTWINNDEALKNEVIIMHAYC